MSLFTCPVCGAGLTRTTKSYDCPAGHRFDLASEGYVNLLTANQKHAKEPGDDKNMVRARSRFLAGGYYDPLLRALETLAVELPEARPVLLDSGCGEGYYTQGLYTALCQVGKQPLAAGIDISKEAVRLAAKRLRDGAFAVASAYRLPLADGCADLVLNCFSPLGISQFRRILKPNGHFFYVVPAPRHLWELKRAVYDKPYENEKILAEYEGFTLEKSVSVQSRIVLSEKQAISDLFTMTPYFWKTPRSGLERLEALQVLETEIAFYIYVYRKKD